MLPGGEASYIGLHNWAQVRSQEQISDTSLAWACADEMPCDVVTIQEDDSHLSAEARTCTQLNALCPRGAPQALALQHAKHLPSLLSSSGR